MYKIKKVIIIATVDGVHVFQRHEFMPTVAKIPRRKKKKWNYLKYCYINSTFFKKYFDIIK